MISYTPEENEIVRKRLTQPYTSKMDVCRELSNTLNRTLGSVRRKVEFILDPIGASSKQKEYNATYKAKKGGSTKPKVKPTQSNITMSKPSVLPVGVRSVHVIHGELHMEGLVIRGEFTYNF